MALTGLEVLQVQGQDANGRPAATTEQTTTGAIAALASLDTANNVITALNTVGAGTITAAGIVGKITKRGGSQSSTPFSDTTDTAAHLLAALPSGAAVGTSFQWTYYNATNATATIGGVTGITVSGETVIPANGFVRYLVTYSAANTFTIVSFESGSFIADATDPTKVVAFNASGQTTATQATIATVNTANATYTLPAATDTLAGIASAQTLTNKTVTDVINTGTVRQTAPVTAVSTTTLAPLTGLAVALTAGATYSVFCALPVTATSGGAAVALAASNSLTATSFQGMMKFFDASSTVVSLNTTTLGGSIGATVSASLVEIDAVIVVNAGGTLIVEGAQNSSQSATTTFSSNGFLQVTRIS